MTCDDAAFDADADFHRWYFGGSPPENDGWDRHAFENALHAPHSVSHRLEAGAGREPIRQVEAFDRLLAA